MLRKLILLLALSVFVTSCSSTDDEDFAGASSTDGAGSSLSSSGNNGGMSASSSASYETRTLEPAEVAREMTQVGDRVFFGLDRYDLDAEARMTLEKQAPLLRSQPAVGLLIEGHTDERGTREYNLALGERRANAVRDYLILLGVDETRIRTVSYGQERPAVVGTGEDIWAQNRRAVTVIVGAEPAS